MVLIFLSGSAVNTTTKRYVNNILNTLFLPDSSRNEYRFAFFGAQVNVDPQLASRLVRLAGRRWKKKEHVLLIFVDRYAAGGYQFRPLRSGLLTDTNIEGDRLFCEVELQEYLEAGPNFANWLLQNAQNMNYPRLVGNNPNEPNDGYYVIHTSAKWKTLPIVARGDQVWIHHVTALAATQRFQHPADHQFFFFRARVPMRRGGGRSFKAKRGMFRIPSNTRFDLTISYRWPFVTNVPNTLFNLDHSKSLRCDLNEVRIASPADRNVIHCKTDRYPEQDEMKIKLVGQNGQNLYWPDAPIRFAIGFSKRQVFLAILALLAIAGASAVTSSNSVSWSFQSIVKHIDWIKFFAEIFNLLGFGCLFIIFGRKII